jgi:hypothetical protein
MATVEQDYSDVTRLDEHFATRRAQELQLAAEAARAEHERAMGAVRNERIRRTGVAALLGGAGIGLACFGASFLIAGQQRVVYTPGPERVVTRDVPAPLPSVEPKAETPLAPAYAPKTPEEKKFTDKPGYKDASYHGRIVKSRDGQEISFEDGQNFLPAHWDTASNKSVFDVNKAFETDQFVGDLAMCTPDEHRLMWCVAFHNNQEVNVSWKAFNANKPLPSRPVSHAIDMIGVDVEIGTGYPVKAIVDTGCSWPMSIPSNIAHVLLEKNLAFRAGASQSVLADGSTSDIEILMIRTVVVDGRTLTNVEAAVSPGSTAPVLLGLGALNQLGTFKIEDGRIVFT